MKRRDKIKKDESAAKAIKRMSRQEFMLQPSVTFASKKSYVRRQKHKRDYTQEYV